MKIQEKVRQLMLSKELTIAEKCEQLRGLIPADVFKIDNMSKATPAQLRQLTEALTVAQAIQKLNAKAGGREAKEVGMSGTSEPGFERSEILRPILDHLEVNDSIVLHGLQQKVLGDLTAKGHPAMSSAAAQLVFQALRDAVTERAEAIVSRIRQVLEGAYVEDFDNLAAGLKAELVKRLESFRDLASLELQRTTHPIRSGIDAKFLPSPTAIDEHLNQVKPKLFAEIDLICAKLHDTQQPRVLFKKGEVFAGNRAARALFTKAKQSLDIIDTYFGAQVFDMLEVTDGSVQIRLISDKQLAPVVHAFHAFNQQFNNRIQFRICAAKDLHDRYVIIDKQQAFHVGHSIKDPGTKDSEIASVPPAEMVNRFEQRTTVVNSNAGHLKAQRELSRSTSQRSESMRPSNSRSNNGSPVWRRIPRLS